MDEWITDRLPTADDADSEGDVTVPCPPYLQNGMGAYPFFKHYSLISIGRPWCPSNRGSRVWPAVQNTAAAPGNPAPVPELADPREQAQLDRYRAETALIEARTTLVLAQAKAIAFPPHPPQSGAIQPPVFPGQPVPDGVLGTRYATDDECRAQHGSPKFQRDER